MNKIAISIAVFFSTIFFSYAFEVPANPSGYVNDYADLISDDVQQSLENDLRLYAASTSNQIAVVTVPSLDGEAIAPYAVKLFEKWKIGDAKKDNGVLLLISRDDRKLRIEVGYGLEGALPDILAKDIIDTKITPYFKQGNYSLGVTEGVQAIKEATKGEYVATNHSKNSIFSLNGDVIVIIFFVILFFIQLLASIFARSKSWWAGGVVGGMLGGYLTYLQIFGASLLVGLGVTAGMVLIGLLFDYIVSRKYQSSIDSGSSVPWWVGGDTGLGGGSFGGGDSFGGFDGGDSGGGGADGDW